VCKILTIAVDEINIFRNSFAPKKIVHFYFVEITSTATVRFHPQCGFTLIRNVDKEPSTSENEILPGLVNKFSLFPGGETSLTKRRKKEKERRKTKRTKKNEKNETYFQRIFSRKLSKRRLLGPKTVNLKNERTKKRKKNERKERF
jgi:hypothetical protein